MAQFQVDWRLRRFAGIRQASLARRIVEEADRSGALVIFSLVDERVARGLIEEATTRGVPVVDVLGGDDGANLHTLYQADLVLTGISRTSKTPLSMYLAQRGYKTGNVPIVPGIDPPTALLDLDPGKVFALAIDPSLLLTIRQARVRVLGVPPHATYADPESLLEEVRRSRRLYREKRWRVVDISGRAAEENAARILRMFEGDSR
jgi:regulator of PEP synthase PpsR (kinase-PPPase family)